MQLVGDHFQADGIPVTSVDDDGVKNPYRLARITVRDLVDTALVQTRDMLPTSDEINCGRCHAPGGSITDTLIVDLADVLQPLPGNFMKGIKTLSFPHSSIRCKFLSGYHCN